MNDLHAIVVLGAAVRDGRPTPTLRHRLDAAVEAFRAGRASQIIVTGRGEAEVMKRYLTRRNVPADAVLVEERARTTRDNARFVAALVPAGARLLIATQPSHMRRALGLFRAAGLEVIGLDAEDTFDLYGRVRERLAYLQHWAWGWLREKKR